MPRVLQVIEVEETRGNGNPGHPWRTVMTYWTFDGTLLAERDPYREVRVNEVPSTTVPLPVPRDEP